MGSFNHIALSSLKIPEGVLPAVADAYRVRYPVAFSSNKYLGKYSYTLVKKLLVENNTMTNTMVVKSILERGDYDALDAVLDSGAGWFSIVQTVLNNWDLCVEDQLRLIRNRAISHDVARIIFMSNSLSAAAKREASVKSGIVHTPKEQSGWEGRTRPSQRMRPERKHEDMDERLHSTVTTLPVLASAFWDIYPLSGAIAERLGQEGPLAVNAWLAFFGLAEGTPDVSLAAVMTSARALAKSEALL